MTAIHGTTSMIAVERVTKRYDASAGATLALEAVELEVRQDEFISVIGPTGCGKTTLLKIVAGLIKPDAGTVRVAGEDVRGPNPHDVAVVFQNFALLPWLTVVSNVSFALHGRGLSKQEIVERARSVLEKVRLTGFENHYPHQLSGGMQQRVGLARALAVDPTVLLMDEPFGALDAQTRRVLQEDLLELWQEQRKTVLFITHAMDEAVYLSDRVAVMTPRPGKIRELVDIPFERPRDPQAVREDARYLECQNYIWEVLTRPSEARSAR